MTRTLRALLVSLLACSPAAAPAAMINSIAFEGPGGTGIVNSITGTNADVTLNFTSADYIDVILNVDAGFFAYGLNQTVLNNTGRYLEMFKIFAIYPDNGPGIQSGTDPSGHFPLGPIFSGGYQEWGVPAAPGPGVADGDFFTPNITFNTNAGYTVRMREFPFVVPEPSTWLLGISGLLAVSAVGMRRQRIARGR